MGYIFRATPFGMADQYLRLAPCPSPNSPRTSGLHPEGYNPGRDDKRGEWPIVHPTRCAMPWRRNHSRAERLRHRDLVAHCARIEAAINENLGD